MAAIPTIVHIGNSEVNGGFPKAPTDPLGGAAYLFWKAKYRYLWSVPADPANGGPPSPVTYEPWFDVSVGDWVVYHHAAGILASPYDSALGDNHTAGGTGFAASAAYMHKFADHYAASPYFKAFKVAYGGSVTDEWVSDGSGSSYNAFETQWAAAVAAASTDTLDVKLIVIDCSGGTDGDISDWASAAASYESDLTDLIGAVRTLVGAPNALVILITHAPSYRLTSGSGVGAFSVQGIHFNIVETLSNVALLQMRDEDLATSTGSYGTLVPGSDRYSYEKEAILKQGEDIYGIFKRWSEGNAPTPVGEAIPVFLHIGDSQGVGNMTAVLLSQLLSPTLQGPRDNEYIYNAVSNSIEKINPGVNTNTAGTQETTVGPILTLTQKLAEKYPNGYVLIHMAKNSSAISGTGLASYTSTSSGRWGKFAGQNYPDLQAVVANAYEQIRTQTGSVQLQKTPLLHGIFIELGDNDTYNLDSGNFFENGARELVRNLRQDFGVNFVGVQTPVVMVRPHIDSVLGNVTARGLVRAAFDVLDTTFDQFAYISVDDLPLGTDGVHYGASTAMQVGYRLFAAYESILNAMVPTP